MMERKTVFFNADQGANGRRTTCNGGLDIVKYGNGTIDLFIRGPKGGLRHVCIIPEADAFLFGQELQSLCSPEGTALAEEVVEALDNVTAAMETVLCQFANLMTDGDRKQREKITAEARAFADRLTGRIKSQKH